MDLFNRTRTWVVLGVLAAAGFLVYQFWVWEITRVEIPSGKFLVKISLWGKELPSGQIIAPSGSYKGIRLGVQTEGRDWINPILYKYELHPAVNVPSGKCLVLIRKYGNEIEAERLRQGDILVGGDEKPLTWDESASRWSGERGIVKKPLGPGTYYLNPHAYDWELQDATEIKTGSVGVRTTKVGKDPSGLPKERNPYLVPEGYRGIQETPLSAGTYYINPHAEKVVPVDVQSVTVRFTDIIFPSTDGFSLNPHVLVKYHVQPEKAPHLLVTLTDKGALFQGYTTQDDQDRNQILQKIVLPLIRGYVRIEGSKFDARDFIADKLGPVAPDRVNPRERLQQTLNKEIPEKCKGVGLNIENITLDHFDIRGDLAALADQITEREQARIKREQNTSLIAQYKTEQTLKANQTLKAQEAESVGAQTRLTQAQTKADQRKAVEKSKLETDLNIAGVRLEAAKEQATAIRARGETETKSITLQNETEVSGLRKAIQGFPSPEFYAQYQIMAKLAPALSEIFASDSSDFAKLFAGYLTGVGARPAGPVGTGSAPTPPMGNGPSGR